MTLLLIHVIINKKLILDRAAVIILIANTSYYFILFCYSKVNVWSYYFIAITTYLLIIMLRKNITLSTIHIVVKYTIYVGLLILILDTIYRYNNPRVDYINSVIQQGKPEYIFYGYKHSFLFQDTNFIGLYTLSLYFLFRNNSFIFKYKKTISAIFIIIMILSLSRASILALFLVELFLVARRKLSLRTIILFVISALIISAIIIFNTTLIKVDNSFLSKFSILNIFITEINNTDITQLLFGWGLDNTREQWNIAAHNIFITLICETGLIGTILFLWVIIYGNNINKKTTPHILSLAIAGLSFGVVFSPILIPLALNIISKEDK